jgi:hypothetical protein
MGFSLQCWIGTASEAAYLSPISFNAGTKGMVPRSAVSALDSHYQL